MPLWQTMAVTTAALVATAFAASAQQHPLGNPSLPRTPPSPPQQMTQAPTAVEAPQSTTATYADWVVQCQTRAGPPAEKICDMGQVTQLQGKNVPFSRVAVSQPVKGQPIKFVVQLPVNASFAANVRVQTSDTDPGVAAPFARCLPGGCFADFDLKDDVVKRMRAASGAGKLSFADAAGHDVSVPISFNGFAQALDALVRE
jgi:invasion protein IalB